MEGGEEVMKSIVNMYLLAVKTKRISIDSIPIRYRGDVKKMIAGD